MTINSFPERAVVTGASNGIGAATVRQLLHAGYEVIGIDVSDAMPEVHSGYTHVVADVSQKSSLPDISQVQILINNAGTQVDADAINTNLTGVINCTEKYGFQPYIRAIVNVASTSAHTGAEFPRYAASKGGVLAYTKYTALQVAKYKATCNSISPGGVITEANHHILQSRDMYAACLDETLLKRWATPKEIAEWICFIAATNLSMTGQDIIIDNGEITKSNFIW